MLILNICLVHMDSGLYLLMFQVLNGYLFIEYSLQMFCSAVRRSVLVIHIFRRLLFFSSI